MSKGALAGAANLGGGGLKAYGDIRSVYDKYQADVSDYKTLMRNKRFAADETKRRSQYEAWRNDVYARRTIGSQRHAFGAAGVELSGTAIDVRAETMKELTLDKVMGLRNAKAEENALRAEAKDAENAYKRARKSGRVGTAIAAASGILDILS